MRDYRVAKEKVSGKRDPYRHNKRSRQRRRKEKKARTKGLFSQRPRRQGRKASVKPSSRKIRVAKFKSKRRKRAAMAVLS